MYHNKRKTYPGHKFVRAIQVIIIVAVAFFGLAALDEMYRQRDVTPDPVTITTYEVPQYTYTQPEVYTPETTYDAYDYFTMGLNHQDANEYKAAIEDYTNSIQLDPTLAASWLNRGVAFEQLGPNSGTSTRAYSDFWEWMSRNSTEIRTASLTTNSTSTLSMAEGRMYVIPFSVKAGQVINISATSTITGQPGEAGVADPLIVLLNNGDRPVAGDDDTLHADGTLINMDSSISDFMVMEDGIYSLVLSHAGGGSYGTVTVSLSVR
jgi:tetratricopeptide (TPR) repeat protein